MAASEGPEGTSQETWLLLRFPAIVAIFPKPAGFYRNNRHRIHRIAFFYALAVLVMPFANLPRLASHVMPQVWEIFDATVRGTGFATSEGKDLVPVILVDIDETTAQKWNFQGRTNRERLKDVLQVISNAHPAAIVIDIDLSDDPNGPPVEPAFDNALQKFVEHYRAKAPLVFIKRTQLEGDGRMTMAPSRYDRLFAKNPSTSWAHAHFVSDADGMTRRWVESVAVCADRGPTPLPAAAIRVLANAQWTNARFDRPEIAGLPRECTPQGDSTPPRALIRSPSGARRAVSPADRIGRLPAWTLTEPGYARDDDRLFGGRVAVIGNTHRSATDRWRTPEGIEPGVELLADTIRFAPRQLASQGKRLLLPAVMLFFFCLAHAVLRPGAAVIAAIAISLAFAWGYLIQGDYGIFDVLETALIAAFLVALAEDFVGFLPELVRHRLRAFLHPAEGK